MPLFTRSLKKSLRRFVLQLRLKEQRQEDLEIACRAVCVLCKAAFPCDSQKHKWIGVDGLECWCWCSAQPIRDAFREKYRENDCDADHRR